MLTMGGIAEFERGLIRKRCEEGIERAKRKGGCPYLPLTRQRSKFPFQVDALRGGSKHTACEHKA
jgi:DNA invertase Pin-like site-specific DNA recombinase